MAPVDSLAGLARLIGTPTKREPATLVSRQTVQTVTIVSESGGNNAQTLSGGAIAGIVIGSIIGFLLLLWIIKSCMNLGAPPQEKDSWYRTEPTRRHRHRSRSRRRGSTSMSRPPPIVIRESRSRGSRSRDSRSRSRHGGVSPHHYRTEDRGRTYY